MKEKGKKKFFILPLEWGLNRGLNLKNEQNFYQRNRTPPQSVLNFEIFLFSRCLFWISLKYKVGK